VSRRIYYVDPEKQRLKQELIACHRAATKSIDPRLLEEARQAIAKAFYARMDTAARPASNPSRVPVDKQKNLETIMMFLEMKTSDSPAQKEIRALMKELLTS
jgi:hypothetical protein